MYFQGGHTRECTSQGLHMHMHTRMRVHAHALSVHAHLQAMQKWKRLEGVHGATVGAAPATVGSTRRRARCS